MAACRVSSRATENQVNIRLEQKRQCFQTEVCRHDRERIRATWARLLVCKQWQSNLHHRDALHVPSVDQDRRWSSWLPWVQPDILHILGGMQGRQSSVWYVLPKEPSFRILIHVVCRDVKHRHNCQRCAPWYSIQDRIRCQEDVYR